MLSLNKYLLGAVVIVFVLMGLGLYWQHATIASQRDTMALQAQAIEGFEKDREAQAKADEQLRADKERIAKERDKYKKDLIDALKDNPCTNTRLPDDAQRLLKELYGSQGSR